MNVTMSQALYMALAFPALVFAALTVTVKNIVHAAICLIGCLLSIAAIYVGLHADFIAAAQIAIYVGAIAILILFSIMFTHDVSGKQMSHLNRQAVLGVFVALALFGAISFFIMNTSESQLTTNFQGQMALPPKTSLMAVGDALYSDNASTPYMVPVEMASFLLLAAVVGGIEMAKKKEDEV
ncbi:MAG TPA: NADH-quinone oxidoreductase subunit J [Caldisericia bacterium]|nr:NADH-quinone oxidoreductase subunit J [Caldisericia bacterium]HOR47064.1 NADH-quinone oxidoreductase subunit J [Caldisericia bacterium]HOU07965.1 NADH-quinone oxidoreductase subunit J [Caldisericia bacterium]HPL88686.1 NADH-quinone oxidoreductase subunit J [Caldisericia bacterium]HQG58945.1 NADH-quinone oxidoreductase subunit J [Caldisericia bacterium]